MFCYRINLGFIKGSNLPSTNPIRGWLRTLQTLLNYVNTWILDYTNNLWNALGFTRGRWVVVGGMETVIGHPVLIELVPMDFKFYPLREYEIKSYTIRS